MAKPLAVQRIEGNLLAFPEASQDASDVSGETSQASDGELSEVSQNSLAALAARYEVSDRTIQNWVKRLADEGKIPDSQLRRQHGIEVEYSPYCITLLDQLIQYRQVHGPKKIGQWFSSLTQSQQENPQFPNLPGSEANPPAVASSPVSGGDSEYRACSIVLHDGIQIDVPSASKSEQVRAALAIRRSEAEEPDIAPPNLNGQADSLLSDALLFNQAVDAFQSKIEAQEQQLQQRLESVQDARELINLNIERIKELDEREQKLIAVGLELSELEKTERATLHSQLKKLLKSREDSQL